MSGTDDMAENGTKPRVEMGFVESDAEMGMDNLTTSEIDDAAEDDAQSETGNAADKADQNNREHSETRNAGSALGPDTPSTRPEYVDFCVDDFPGGLQSCLEAILMVADQPQQAADLARVLATDEDEVTAALESMQREYDGDAARGLAPRGFELRHTARGWQYGNRAVFEPVVSAFVTDGQMARLSQAALEALAIVAYKQPVTRAQIAAIRGVNSDGVVRALNVRGLIREEGADPDSRAAFLVTTGLFLEKMGLESLDQLPQLAPFMPAASDVVSRAEQADTAAASVAANAAI